MTRQVTPLPVTEKNVGAGNWDTTRKPIDRVIIHTMVGTAASAASRFYNPTSQVSAHYGVLLDGSIWHWVDEDNTAYHAGYYPMNQRSIGIEHEDNGDYNGVRTDALYTTSAKLVRDICTFYQISIDRQHILKHSEVIATGCPDALDIERIVREAAGGPNIIIDQLKADLQTTKDLYQKQVQHGIDQEDSINALHKSNDLLTQEVQSLKDDAKVSQDSLQGLRDTNSTLVIENTSLKADKQKAEMDLSICLSQRKDLAKWTSPELAKELKTRKDVSFITKIFL